MIKKAIKSVLPVSIKRLGLQHSIRSIALGVRGTTYHCTICKQDLNSFISLDTICDGKFIADVEVNGVKHSVKNYETLNIENFLCPVCGAQDKARLYALFLKQKLSEIKSNQKVKLLHFAPEGGLDTFLKLNNKVDYTSADLFRTDVDMRVDLTDMDSFESESIDAFICSHILEHIPDDKAAVDELFRTLKVGGWGIVMVPILLSIEETYEDSSVVSEQDRLKHFGQEDHVRIYSKAGFIELLQEAGFLVKQLGEECFGANSLLQAGLSSTNVLYVVEKQ